MTTARKPRLRDRLRPYLLGAASLFDLSGSLTYREARRALPPADDWEAVGGYFGEAGRLISEAMNDCEGKTGEGPASQGRQKP
jgi:hypothetical protein